MIFLNIYEYYKLDVTPGPIKTYPDDIVKFAKVMLASLFVLFILYSLSGTYGYLTYGESVASDIMLMYDPYDPVVCVGIVALNINMITTYPGVMFCGRDTLIAMVCRKPGKFFCYFLISNN